MGWSYTTYRGKLSIKAELDKLHTWSSDGVTRRVLLSRMIGTTYYAAVESIHLDGDRHVWASVCLTKRLRHEWGYKGMDESMGPIESRCPAAILALLTPSTDATANEWRERCRRNLANTLATKKPKPGMVLQYGQHQYRLDMPAGPRRGWLATRVSDGMHFRIKAKQINDSTEVTA